MRRCGAVLRSLRYVFGTVPGRSVLGMYQRMHQRTRRS